MRDTRRTASCGASAYGGQYASRLCVGFG